jgi:hypothetical protein
LLASGWADNEANQPLGAHSFTQRTRCRVDQKGNLRWHSDHGPVVAVGTVGYGYSPTALTSIDGSGAWVENDANVILPIGAYSGAWSGSLQFGTPAAYGEMFVRATCAAGYVATALASGASAGATSLTVTDPTGIAPGGTYRIWEPGVEEMVTVASTWVPPAVGSTPAAMTVTLAAPTVAAHTSGADLSGMPDELRLAVTSKAVAMLMRPDVQVENAYPNAANSSSIRTKSGKTSADYAADAARILASYGRVR